MPVVSVVIPAYNAAPFLRAALDSVLGQSFADFEVLVIDDASTDSTPELLATYTDPRLKVYRNPQNLGIAGTRNRGVSLCQTKYLAWLDADDVCTPDRLERQVAFLESHPEFVLCASNVRSIDREGALLSGPWWDRRSLPLEWELCWTNPIAQSSVVLRRSALANDAPSYDPSYVPAEDYHLWSRLAFAGRMYRLPQVLVHYRILEGSAYHSKKDHATRMALTANAALVEALTHMDVLARLTSFSWKPDVTDDRLDFVSIRAAMTRVLTAASDAFTWSPQERLQAMFDLDRRLFRVFFAPEAAPYSTQARHWLATHRPLWWLLLAAKTLLRAARGRR